MQSLDLSELSAWLESEAWQGRFDGSALAGGKRLTAAIRPASELIAA